MGTGEARLEGLLLCWEQPQVPWDGDKTSWHGEGLALCTLMQRCPTLTEPRLNVSADNTLQESTNPDPPAPPWGKGEPLGLAAPQKGFAENEHGGSASRYPWAETRGRLGQVPFLLLPAFSGYPAPSPQTKGRVWDAGDGDGGAERSVQQPALKPHPGASPYK